MAKKFEREDCGSVLGATVTDQLGRTVSLFGTHAFGWSMVIASDNSITMRTFKKGDIAGKEFNEYKRKKIMEDMINTENAMAVIMVIAFFAWLFMRDQKGAGE